MLQLAVNLSAIVLAGVGDPVVQRRLYVRRRRAHLHDSARENAGLPLGPQPAARQCYLQGPAGAGMRRTTR